MTPVIRLDQVSKRFGHVQALDRASLTVAPGSVCALLGANGAGKSTALKILLGLEHADSGVAEVLGMPAATHGLEIRRRVGYVAEKPSLYDWMRVDEIGWFAAGFYPSGYQQTYARYIERFGLDGRQKIKTLSKGMRAKVSLALSLAHRPDLLILDEPTSGLDPLVRREFLESMVDIAAEGRTVLLSSHQVAEVERVADTVAILLNGVLVCVERLEDLKQSAREVIVTLPDPKATSPDIPGRVLGQTVFGHEQISIVRDLDEAELHARMSRHGDRPYEVRRPDLEEILLTLLREARTRSKSSPAAVSVAGEVR
jgi:ABC-2 type transport system ATP-binding protein